jgi:DNA (cytosine-5)-methyltransferase 1
MRTPVRTTDAPIRLVDVPAAAPMVDLFAGAGGLSLGLTAAGFDPVRAVESDVDACATYSELHPRAELDPGPIEGVKFRPLRGAVALLAGGPPCQPFSTGGKQLGAADARDGLPHFLRALDELQPDAFLIENVAGLAAASMRRYFDCLLADLRALKYAVAWKVVNAADYGVPQKRRRLFIVGMRGLLFEFPHATHGPGSRRPWAAAGAVLSLNQIVGEPNPSIVTYAKRPDIRPSPYAGQLFNGGGRPIDLKSTAPTILAAAGGNKTPFLDPEEVVAPYHAHLLSGGKPRKGRVSGARRITVEESARLQTFPPGTLFSGRRSTQYTLVGNAVPPRLAEAIGKALRAALDGQGYQIAA